MLPHNNSEKIEHIDQTLKLAVLIDADNAQAAVIEPLLAEIARYGEATVKRIYGDFTSSHSTSWKKVLQKYAIKPVQQFAYSTGKNATDSALIIDAMDLLYTRKFNGFCLITSDSDFTGLAMRLREEGLTVFGFGEQKTPEAFRNSCHKFIFTEVLRQSASVSTENAKPTNEDDNKKPKSESINTIEKPHKIVFPKEFMLTALEQSSDDTGWANISIFGSYLTKLQPDFDSRLYGFKKLSDLIKGKSDIFIIEERPQGTSGKKVIFLKAKTQENKKNSNKKPVK